MQQKFCLIAAVSLAVSRGLLAHGEIFTYEYSGLPYGPGSSNYFTGELSFTSISNSNVEFSVLGALDYESDGSVAGHFINENRMDGITNLRVRISDGTNSVLFFDTGNGERERVNEYSQRVESGYHLSGNHSAEANQISLFFSTDSSGHPKEWEIIFDSYQLSDDIFRSIALDTTRFQDTDIREYYGNESAIFDTLVSSNSYLRTVHDPWISPQVIPAGGDYDGNGTVDADDWSIWRVTYGENVIPGDGADGNGDGLVDAADYVIWRDALSLSGAAVPEPSMLLLVSTLLTCQVVSYQAKHRVNT